MKSRTDAELIQALYAIVNEFEQKYPGRRFTPDGHLVGSLGEAIAAERYGLKLYPASVKTHDAVSPCGKEVQIKITQNESGMIGLRSEPEHLLVLYLARDGNVSELFNGPGALAWREAGDMPNNGQRPLSIRKLKRLAEGILVSHRIQPTDAPLTTNIPE